MAFGREKLCHPQDPRITPRAILFATLAFFEALPARMWWHGVFWVKRGQYFARNASKMMGGQQVNTLIRFIPGHNAAEQCCRMQCAGLDVRQQSGQNTAGQLGAPIRRNAKQHYAVNADRPRQ